MHKLKIETKELTIKILKFQN